MVETISSDYEHCIESLGTVTIQWEAIDKLLMPKVLRDDPESQDFALKCTYVLERFREDPSLLEDFPQEYEGIQAWCSRVGLEERDLDLHISGQHLSWILGYADNFSGEIVENFLYRLGYDNCTLGDFIEVIRDAVLTEKLVNEKVSSVIKDLEDILGPSFRIEKPVETMCTQLSGLNWGGAYAASYQGRHFMCINLANLGITSARQLEATSSQSTAVMDTIIAHELTHAMQEEMLGIQTIYNLSQVTLDDEIEAHLSQGDALSYMVVSESRGKLTEQNPMDKNLLLNSLLEGTAVLVQIKYGLEKAKEVDEPDKSFYLNAVTMFVEKMRIEYQHLNGIATSEEVNELLDEIPTCELEPYSAGVVIVIDLMQRYGIDALPGLFQSIDFERVMNVDQAMFEQIKRDARLIPGIDKHPLVTNSD